MRNDQSSRRARINRRKAVFWTVLFHVVLIGGLTLGSNGELVDLVPDFIIDLFTPEVETAADHA